MSKKYYNSSLNRSGERWTEEELLNAISLKESKKLTWYQVAEKFQRSTESLTVMVSRYKKGKIKFVKNKNDELLDIMAEEVIKGSTISSTARKYNRQPRSLYASLLRIGYDRETIAEARMDFLP